MILINKPYLNITGLRSDYLRISYNTETSFGGSQSWFGNENGGEIIKNQGCGLIAMSDLILYLAGRNKKYLPDIIKPALLNAPVSYSDYRDFVMKFNDRYVNLKMRFDFDINLFGHRLLSVRTNNIDGNIGRILNNYFRDNNIPLKAKWGVSDSSVYSGGIWFEKGIRRKSIKEMLRNDIPVIISVGPKLSGKTDGINCYRINKDGMSYEFTGQKIANHYFTVTAVTEDKRKAEKGEYDSVMYEVSSWGKKYYVSEYEIRRFRRYNSSVFTNVLYCYTN